MLARFDDGGDAGCGQDGCQGCGAPPYNADWLTCKRHRLWPREREDSDGNQLSLRAHRAISWIASAESTAADNPDLRFIGLWIAFNAAYAEDPKKGDHVSEGKSNRDEFLYTVVSQDREGELADVVYDAMPDKVERLLDTPYAFEPFWRYHNGAHRKLDWPDKLKQFNAEARASMRSGHVAPVLKELFMRMYTLRNQLMHGGATWKSYLNRELVSDCADLMGALVPRCVSIMLDSTDGSFQGRAYYQPIDDDRPPPPPGDVPFQRG